MCIRDSIVTAGCGGGITFDDLSAAHVPLSSALTATPAQLAELMRRLHQGAAIYQQARGIHTAVPVSYTHLDVYKRQGRRRHRRPPLRRSEPDPLIQPRPSSCP